MERELQQVGLYQSAMLWGIPASVRRQMERGGAAQPKRAEARRQKACRLM